MTARKTIKIDALGESLRAACFRETLINGVPVPKKIREKLGWAVGRAAEGDLFLIAELMLKGAKAEVDAEAADEAHRIARDALRDAKG